MFIGSCPHKWVVTVQIYLRDVGLRQIIHQWKCMFGMHFASGQLPGTELSFGEHSVLPILTNNTVHIAFSPAPYFMFLQCRACLRLLMLKRKSFHFSRRDP